MTPARRTLIAFCIALATAFAVAVLAIVDASHEPNGFERIYRD
jgi:hypothetical protein